MTICYNNNIKPMLITGGRDGKILIWDPCTLERMGQIKHKDQNTVYSEVLLEDSKGVGGGGGGGGGGSKSNNKNKSSKEKQNHSVVANCRHHISKNKGGKTLITSLASMSESSHICVGSVDGSITWYDLTTCEPCGRYNDLHAIPNTIAVLYIEKKTITRGLVFIPDKQSTPDKKMSSNASDTVRKKGNNELDINEEAVKIESIPTIVIGDSEGFLHILTLDSDFKSSIDSAQKVKNEQYLKAGIKNVMKFRVKNKDTKVWITSIVYIPELSLIAAGLEDGDIILVDIQKRTVKDIYTGHNTSTVVSLAWSSMGKYICSVGERKIIVWDAFNVKTLNQLEGLTASAVLAIVSDRNNKLFIGAVDKSIRVWHNITFELIQIILDSNYYEPENTLYSFFLEPSSCNLYTAGNLITLWSLERLRSFEGDNDDMIDDICSMLYNKTFKTLFVISNAGSVVIYNIEDGSDCNRFQIPYPRRSSDDEAQVLQIIAKKAKFIQQASLDASDRRLIVLTSRGSIQFCKIFIHSFIILFIFISLALSFHYSFLIPFSFFYFFILN